MREQRDRRALVRGDRLPRRIDDVLGPLGLREVEDARAADDDDARQHCRHAEISRPVVDLPSELREEVLAVGGEDAACILGDRYGAERVDDRDATGAILGVDAVVLGPGEQREETLVQG